MVRSRNELLKDILNNRKSLIELIAVGVLIGFGTEFLAGAIYGHFDFKHKNLIFAIFGSLLIGLGILYFIFIFFGKSKYTRKLDGFFAFDRNKKEIVKIDNYDFADKLERNIRYALNEDNGLKKIWGNLDLTTRGWTDDYKEFYRIANEAAEYYLIEKLSMHLSGFFNNTEFDDKEIIEYGRNDISSLLLKNRFLELFSKPMEQREPFIPDKPIKKEVRPTRGKIVSSYAKGAMFQHFDLRLPKKSSVTKEGDNSILITTQRFSLRLKAITSGVNTYIPWEYYNYFLGVKNIRDDISAYKVTFEAEVKFNFGSLFKPLGWQYYNWLDTFLLKLEQDFEQEYYFEKKIEWDKSYVVIKSILLEGNTDGQQV